MDANMPDSGRGANGRQMAVRNRAVLRAQPGFRDAAELTERLQSDRFQRYFNEYARVCVLPQQSAAQAKGSRRRRGPDLAVVEPRLTEGERPGNDKFSDPGPDKSGWDQIDHLAHLLYLVRRANTKNVRGLFYGKGFSDAKLNVLVWALIKFAGSRLAPSTMSKGKRSTSPLPTAPPAAQLQSPGDDESREGESDDEIEPEGKGPGEKEPDPRIQGQSSGLEVVRSQGTSIQFEHRRNEEAESFSAPDDSNHEDFSLGSALALAKNQGSPGNASSVKRKE